MTVFDRVGEVLREVAASVVMPRFAALRPDEIVMKGADDPVTVADREAETMIARRLRLLLPTARIVGEEACAANPALIERLDEGLVWIIDPIDGTANFAAARPPFAMMVALLEHGVTVGAWILDPRTGRLAAAELGGGAWLDGRTLRASSRPKEACKLRGIVSTAFLPADQRGMIDRLRMTVGEIHPTARCAGHEYPLVAIGERDFALYWRTLVWDHAPGTLLLTEAGGVAVHLDGTAYRPAEMKTGLLLSHGPDISRTLLAEVGTRARP